MSSKLKVEYLDGRVVEINAGPRAHVAFERQFDISITEMDRAEHVYYLAWAALHFAGQEKDKDFEDFLDRIDEVEKVDGDEPVDPTPPDQHTES
jgi:hypothetical protein